MFNTYTSAGATGAGAESGASPTPESPDTQVSRHTQRLRQKRSQVVRACDWCRTHRVKCDNSQPCSNCRSKGNQCSNNDAAKVPTLPHAHREIGRLKQQIRELEQQLQQERERGAKPDLQLHTPASSSSSQFSSPGNTGPEHAGPEKPSWKGIHIRTARSPYETWYGPSSLCYFIGRITMFLSSSLQQAHSSHHMLPNSASKLLDGPTTSATEAHGRQLTPPSDSPSTGEYLSPTQEEYFIDLYWQSYHTGLFPIINETDFKEHYRSLWAPSSTTRKPSALVDIVLAMCMQFGISKLPSNRQRGIMDNNDATIAGRWHYRRCQMLLGYESESPSISTFQCHLLCAIYLCSGSFQNMADSACGLAVRTAYMLGLHLDPPEAMPLGEREMRRRLWWSLYALDSKIGMKLGRPFLLHDSNAMPSPSSDKLEAAMLSGSTFAPLGEESTWLSFGFQITKLFRTARTAHVAFYDTFPNARDIEGAWGDLRSQEAHAKYFVPYAKSLEEWAQGVPRALKTSRQNDGSPFSTDGSALDIEQFAPLWLQRQRLNLELMYHNLSINLHRPFISFATTTMPSPAAEEAAIKTAAHAITLTKITHQVLSSTSILAGWHEAFQLQWNAAMTLVGFVLAYPQGVSTPGARSAIDLSVAVFEIFGNNFAAAVSAATIMRDLAAKADLLVEQSRSRQATIEVDQNMHETAAIANSATLNQQPFMTNTVIGPAALAGFQANDESAATMQNVFDMAFAVDLWNDFDMLWPDTGDILPEY